MRLSLFIHRNLDAILQEWEDFAVTLAPLADADRVELRDHATAVLNVIITDLDTAQNASQSIAKSKGHGPVAAGDTAAEVHAAARMASGLNSDQVMAEFRALRSSVLRLWARSVPITTAEEIQDMVRFNEAIDQAQSESMARYSKLLRDAQSLFLAILGHDVRSPLGAVSMGAQVLLHDQTLPAKVLKVGLRIFNSAKRVDEIVRDLLDFSTSHLGEGIPIDPYTVDLDQICLNVVEEARTFHPERHIELVSEGNLVGTWDGPRLAQAFSNLISNAIQHGKPEGTIRIAINGSAADVLFEVRNEAEVIPPAKLRTLFDPVKSFAIRPPSERSISRVQNLGLGLYVVKEIVKAHEGRISVSSTQEAGVSFTISLPRLTPHRRDSDA
ncbi:HAMP domain-containing histidine kinase [Massilia antarctica]|uniref:histidine kinase n=1 Tax=Massilia antarctica TaxID=2765360 RepID=A0AA48WD35_9BURK|nr:HAMP domain-containing sensor histidine kinase [Massilia antarctica]QPI49297.1 HAMP domain-containing histidine kinase [Massilia antarctica]